MTATHVRDWDPGDGRISTSNPGRVPTRSVGSGGPSTDAGAVPPRTHLAAGVFPPDWSEIVAHFREGLLVCAPDGVVQHVSPGAARLLPTVRPGDALTASAVPELAAMATTGERDGDLTHAGRRLRVRRVPLGDGGSGWYVEDVTEAVERADALLAEQSRSAFLARVGEKLGNPLHPDRAAAAATRLAVPTLADVAVLVLAPRAGRAGWFRAVRDGAGPAVVDRGVLAVGGLPPAIEQALSGAEPHTVDWLVEQAAGAGWLPGPAEPDRIARVVPVPGAAAPVGALLVTRSADRPFDEGEEALLRAFAARAGAALTTAVLYREQTRVADTLQASLVPVEPVATPGLRWGTAYRPAQAGLRIGGDFYGTHVLADGGVLFFLGDVSGKGVEAAVFTGQLRQCLQALRRVEHDPARLLGLLNDALLETTQAHGQGRFATMVVGVARSTPDGGAALTLAGGGHLPPLVLRASGEVETVPLRGMLIGVVPDPRIGRVDLRLAPGETCLLYSDGVTEARGGPLGGEMYGAERLVEALTGCHRMPAAALAERVEQLACDWLTDGDHDDIAALTVRADGGAG
ncbi:PP2C family protein-serine/threonine phosphatase [Micromonospora echinofusca]|uniref:SpoIIE family protein phosphatase n=1 Tax=Micromonospora echinofusca TaxID=47858 RepID=A0ABS3VWD2_MICEH|nr:PP2C family protein-serine/threonine phosphatase [Micromonospora echinofusca]MBO4208808.1 SpoIIE family protein phosphatase [Micromonospora echinofusca]